MILRELKQAFLKDPRRATFLFGAALAYSIIFGILYMPGVVKHVPFVVYDEEQSVLSRDLTRRFEDNENFKIVGYVSSQEELQQALIDKKAYVALQIPADLSKKVKTGSSSNILFHVNGSNIILTNITSSAAQDIIAEFSDAVAAKNAAMRTSGNEILLKKKLSPVHSQLRVSNNPTQSYMMFFLLGLACAAYQQGIFLAVGAAVYSEYEDRKIHKQVGAIRILTVKFATYLLMSIASWGLILLAMHAFNLTTKSSLLPLFMLGTAFAFAAIAMSMMFATLFHRESQYVRASIMYTVPAFIFGGYTWPIESMGVVTSTLAAIFPMAYLSNAVRYLFLSGSLYTLSFNLSVLCLMGCVFGAVAYYRFPRHIKKNLER